MFSSSVTRGAGLERFDAPFFHELFAMQLLQALVFFGVLAPFPVQIGDVLRRTDLGGRITMAIQAERHAQRLKMINFIHFVDRTMTFHAANPSVHVHGMIEIDKIGHAMNLNPGDGNAIGRAVPNQLQPRVILEDLIVTIHANRTGWDVGIPRFLNGIMAVAAIDAQLAGVSGMGKRNWLDRLIPDARVFWSEIIPHAGSQSAASQQQADDNHRRQPVSPFWKNG